MLSPITWRLHGDLIEYIVASSADRPTVKADPVRTSHSTPSDWRDVLQNLKRRSKALHFQPTSAEDTSSPRRHQMAEIHVCFPSPADTSPDVQQKLDAMDADTNMSDLCKSIFDANSSPSASSIDKDRLEGKVFILLNWAMGLFALGNHRFYAVYTLLKLWSEQYDEHRPKPFDFFPILYKWLDTSPAARKDDNTLAIGITYGELTRQGIFSYGRYLQTLIAYGHTARSRSSDHRPSHHLAILRALPIFAKAKDLLHQRRIALCGADVELRLQDEMEEEQAMEAFKEDVREYVPEIFGWSESRKTYQAYKQSAMAGVRRSETRSITS